MTSGQASAKVARNSVAQLDESLMLAPVVDDGGATVSVIFVSHTHRHALVERRLAWKMGTEMADWVRRVLVGVAGLLGAVGVATAAMASHGEDVRNLAAISAMALAHAPVLLIVGLIGRSRPLAIAGLVLAAGCTIFVADLAMRHWVGTSLFPGAAPIGGGGMILGWLGVAVAGMFRGLLNE